ncbi:MAG: thiamine phosphate synthase [Magnetococcales bacterium]|nr:thiamine phosphate synthase [Magnetococcales bacterium]MBF0115874.1 thiamine phosphate synthase [Magnetococcales bacterium]
MGTTAVNATVPPVLLITDPSLGPLLPERVAAALAGGVRHLLVRHKDANANTLLTLAQTLQPITQQHGAVLLIHDRLDIALALQAAGIHLPENGLPTRVARRLLPHGIIGRSCHSVAHAQQALQEGADYVTLSPVFATRSHPQAKPLGLEQFRLWREQINGPVLALGGVTPANAPLLRQAGADGVALMRGLLEEERPETAAYALICKISHGLAEHG